ncbi:hypothetical protein AB1Y20_002991 [Prymnesium parvum]|uniref:NAD(P)H-hydrate epimerase n=1 Tax=Prymnesium parvum TaxID=97485 RepID=A0AB34JAK4_PRYPA
MPHTLKLLSAAEASSLDDELRRLFSEAQLAELAGFAFASAIAAEYELPRYARVLVVLGAGANGRDGMAAARHLAAFGYAVPILRAWPANASSYELLVDAVFGHRYTPPPRPPFAALLAALRASAVPLVSLDVPSGWPVDADAPPDGAALAPHGLVSLLAPKRCALHFDGAHLLAGRHVPPPLAARLGLHPPHFAAAAPFVRLEGLRCDAAEGRCTLRADALPLPPSFSAAAAVFSACISLVLLAYAVGALARSECRLFGLLWRPGLSHARHRDDAATRSSTRDAGL